MLGWNTKTPELKQSGQPTSGAAENSSRSKSSSQFERILKCKFRKMSSMKLFIIQQKKRDSPKHQHQGTHIW